MAETQHDLLIIYTSKNGRTGAMVEPIRQGMHDEGGRVSAREREYQVLAPALDVLDGAAF